MSTAQAQEVYPASSQFRHLGARAERNRRAAADAERRQLRGRLLGVDEGIDEEGAQPPTYDEWLDEYRELGLLEVSIDGYLDESLADGAGA
jgi:hypothetical protein